MINVHRNPGLIKKIAVAVVLLIVPTLVDARGGGGGGGMHGGGSGGFGGGPRGGGFGGGPRAGAVAGPGFRGYGGGYRGFAAARPAYFGGYRGYGWGYPYYGYGLGLGLGLGYGLSAGYGYGGYGYGGYGYGYPAYNYGYTPYGGSSYYGAGNYYGSGNYYGAGNAAPPNSVAQTPAPPNPEPPDPVVPASATMFESATPAVSSEFADKGAVAFKASDYKGAVHAWRHAVVDDPRNAKVTLQLAQALFAIGKFQEAAGATQAAMHQLPQEDWGSVVIRYSEFYGDPKDYTVQLQSLEKAIKAKPADPALRFLAGYHYGYLGFLKPSIDQLDRVIEIESRDEMAKKLREEMKDKLAKLDTSHVPPPAPTPYSSATWTKSK